MSEAEIWNVIILLTREKKRVLLNLKETDFQKDYMDIEFIFKLRNTVGYKYTETVNVRFSKMENASWYYISKYNMSFDK